MVGDRLRGRRERGSLEHDVLQVLRGAPDPLTPGQTRDALPGGDALAYTTVMTTLARLHDKGAVTRVRVGRAYAYSAVADDGAVRASALAKRMRRVLDSGADRRGVLARFVGGLDEADEATLRALLDELGRDDG
ncbi:putative transcriptional regulator [Motilibacter peucedani]|uniref:Putative transcriptional regulator n=1 Tax=Motilibacter peucedani TaxID=598650 RepID=A0A420XTG3_9ACTN|nr:BlaI/MecI/CopY family transcriptional regulator [Motilibacter peucedani]RKS80050.1 putative transcriptional regulator [Motilibacter peucedani]